MPDEIDTGKIFGEVISAFTKNEELINETIYPESPSMQKGELTPTLLRGYGNPSSIFVKLSNKDTYGKERNYLVRYFNRVPETYKGKLMPWEIGYAQFKFLDSAKIDCIPKTLLLDGVPKILFMKFIEGKTLFQKLKEVETLEERIKLMESVLKPLANFQYRATQRYIGLNDEQRKNLFSGRSMDEKAREYFEKTFFAKEKTGILSKLTKAKNRKEEELLTAYRLIARAHQGYCVLHGDLSPTNIIIGEDKKVYLIDYELEIGNGLNDVGSLLAYSGLWFDFDKKWIDFGRKFKREKLETIVRESGGEIEGELKIQEDEKKRVDFVLLASIFHKSFKALAKNQGTHLYPAECEERLITQKLAILGKWFSDRESFELTDEDIEAARILISSYESPSISPTYCNHSVEEIKITT